MALDADTVAALEEALEDEHKARATYRAVLAAFGPVRPFANIVESEGRHAAALERLFARHGLVAPQDQWEGRVAAPPTLAEACEAAVAAEVENAAMYDRLLAQVTTCDVRAVLERLRDASQQNHLPAFRRCLARLRDGHGAGQGDDAGEGRGRRRRHRGGRSRKA